ncbi:helix-turn-helix transcriptional regulator [Mycobacterium yunnanensis]|uniref:Helix-turn-helix transcriptional regulator n=1 Tax=Mycobacterium yunnanensis TaxID=368477 RepID=A0A9X2Z7H1_9MYCO|nr:TetR/AcrR family transcriptional regulator [Mycobacterium yunnanensis]MCV7424525.1 helix-turn-helix transcriptional regulator [Mycobacterium yunnanensis]
MARSKEFDPEVALDAAMRLFWRNGFARTSTQDLVAELGIARASLYDTFGSKRGLYLAALDSYLAGAGGQVPQLVAQRAESGLAAVRALLKAATALPEVGLPPGCFTVNATVEHGDGDSEISARLDTNRDRMESVFRGALARARAEGTLGADVDLDTAAVLLSTVLTGLQVLSRAGESQSHRIDRTIDATMNTLFVSTRLAKRG